MLDRRPWRLDVTAACLFCSGVALALAVYSHDPADLPGVVYPTNSTARNLLGLPGAHLARGLLQALGLAVHVFLASWFVLALMFLVRRWRSWSLRLFGWLLLVPCAAVVADRLGEAWRTGAQPGQGGFVGAWLAAWLAERFQPTGVLALLGGCLLLGSVLALDQLFLLLYRAASFVLRRALSVRGPARPLPVRALVPDLSDEDPDTREDPADEAWEPEDELDGSGPRTIPIHHHGALAEQDAQPVPSDQERFADYELPPLSLLEDAKPFAYHKHDKELRDRAALLEKTFTDFGLNVRVVGINTGPVITQFEIALETGLRVAKVTRLTDDIALNLKVPSVRMVAPIPGKNTVGVEVPNEHRADVRLKEVIVAAGKKAARSKIPLFLGKDSEGRPLVYDLADMPHLLIAGSTGTGKSVCLNAIILSMLMTRRPDEVKLIMIDPKNGVEMEQYGRIPHLMHPIVIDMKKAEAILAWAVDKMEERYDLLRRARVRNLAAYNDLKPGEVRRRLGDLDPEERDRVSGRMPYIVIVIDEMADLMMMMKKEVEGHIIRLAQKSRAAGIHLVVATQKPTVDVITGLIKSNLPARVCFKVVNKSDSRVVLDEMGADKLLGKGDMLFLPPGTSSLVRAQGTYASDKEIAAVVEALECEPCYAPELIELEATGGVGGGDLHSRLKSRDELYEAAVEVVVREGRGSVSLLQRALGIGYGRAARLIDYMAEDGIVGAYNGSNARDVLYTPEQWRELQARADEPAA
jgi:S-DNA-T family DNA segregation ATPase FtsK/SpoIIIE